MAKKLIALGHTVIGCGRSGTEIFDLRMDHGAPHDFMVCDVALDAKVALWAAKVLEHDAAPDILINNAGVMNPLGPLWLQSDREFTKAVDVNVRGVAPEVAPYCATKWAIEGLTKALAEELPAGMAAVPLNPGVIDTDMLRACWAEGATNHPKAEAWAEVAAPFILKLGAKDNGRSLSVGGFVG